MKHIEGKYLNWKKDCKELNYNQKRVEGGNVLPTVSDGVGLGKMIC